MSQNIKTVLVTGCAGFIGSHFTEKLLSEGYKVIGVDNFDEFYSKGIKVNNLKVCTNSFNFKFVELDITDIHQVNKIQKVDIVFHFAAKAGVRPSILNPINYINTNIIGTQNILNWMHSQNIKKMVFASSSSVYGNNVSKPFSENDIVDNPISPYAFTKKSCELLNFTYHHLYKMSIINLRFFTVYGPRQRPDLAINKFITNILNDKPIEIYGDGTSSRDYTFISDIVSGIYSSIDLLQNIKATYEIINLGNSSPVSLNTMIATIEKCIGKKANKEYLPVQEGDVDITYANINKAKDLLNYNPVTTLEQGISDYINWKKLW